MSSGRMAAGFFGIGILRAGSMSMSDEFKHARLLQDFGKSGATVEDLARAWASIDGKCQFFDDEKGMSIDECTHGHYLGYLEEAEEVLKRAAKYAAARRG